MQIDTTDRILNEVAEQVLAQEVVLCLRTAWRSEDSKKAIAQFAKAAATVAIDELLSQLDPASESGGDFSPIRTEFDANDEETQLTEGKAKLKVKRKGKTSTGGSGSSNAAAKGRSNVLMQARRTLLEAITRRNGGPGGEVPTAPPPDQP